MRETELALLHNYLVIGAMLFGIGLVGFLARRNMIVMFLAAEMMLQGVSLSLVAFSRFHDNWAGQMLVVFIITVAGCEAAVALALVTMLFRRRGSLDVALWQELREETQPPYVDREIPSTGEAQPAWPQLTPAGVEPQHPREEALHRGGV